MGTVSVILDCENRSTLERAAESVLNQSYPDIEVLLTGPLVGDQPIPAILDSDPRVRHASSARSSDGVAKAIGASVGDYLIALSSWDILHPDLLAIAVRALEENQHVGFVYTSYHRFTPYGVALGRVIPYDFDLLKIMDIVGPSVVVRRRAYEDAGGFRAGMASAALWDLAIGMGEAGWEGMLIGEPLFGLDCTARDRDTLPRETERRLEAAVRRNRRKSYPVYFDWETLTGSTMLSEG